MIQSSVGSLDLESLPFLTSVAFNTVRVLITLFPFFLIAIVILWQSGDWERRGNGAFSPWGDRQKKICLLLAGEKNWYGCVAPLTL